jgi:hypothetical protein
MKSSAKKLRTSEAGILERLVAPEFNGLSRDLAKRILAMRFGPTDLARINQLSAKAKGGALTRQEDEELESYLRIGHMLSTMKSKARQVLKKGGNSR